VTGDAHTRWNTRTFSPEITRVVEAANKLINKTNRLNGIRIMGRKPPEELFEEINLRQVALEEALADMDKGEK
jgi:hypothetical protein